MRNRFLSCIYRTASDSLKLSCFHFMCMTFYSRKIGGGFKFNFCYSVIMRDAPLYGASICNLISRI
jgi:hypothetical protein